MWEITVKNQTIAQNIRLRKSRVRGVKSRNRGGRSGASECNPSVKWKKKKNNQTRSWENEISAINDTRKEGKKWNTREPEINHFYTLFKYIRKIYLIYKQTKIIISFIRLSLSFWTMCYFINEKQWIFISITTRAAIAFVESWRINTNWTTYY